jgi:hypothetical protein
MSRTLNSGGLSLGPSAFYFRDKAAQCRRLAKEILYRNDPAIDALLALAAEFDAKAAEVERGVSN